MDILNPDLVTQLAQTETGTLALLIILFGIPVIFILVRGMNRMIGVQSKNADAALSTAMAAHKSTDELNRLVDALEATVKTQAAVVQAVDSTRAEVVAARSDIKEFDHGMELSLGAVHENLKRLPAETANAVSAQFSPRLDELRDEIKRGYGEAREHHAVLLAKVEALASEVRSAVEISAHAEKPAQADKSAA